MKRRDFVKNISLASVAAPFVWKGMKYQGIAKKLFDVPKSADDRVLVIIRLNGGNDGLATVIPIDQYDNLVIQRQNVLIPQAQLLSVTPTNSFHPNMSGMKSLFDDGKLGVIQNVGYPQQNRSHFRSMDIWTSGILNDSSETRGWMGRKFDQDYPNYPDGYPNATYPDPFAIAMGNEVSATCQGVMANYSMAVNDPNTAYNLAGSTQVDDGSYYSKHMVYIANLIDQTNAYGQNISTAYNAGNNLSTLYDANNPTAMQLKNVAKLIKGGLQTKVYVLNINGFDTHNAQVSATDVKQGEHANLLKQLSDAVHAFQDDLRLLGLESRVAGMTFSEFGRQIASNASLGTDHGDAAPLFLFGSCVNNGFLGDNPTIGNSVINQEGIPMQIDFRDVYASVLRDWFMVSETNIQALFEHTVTFYNVLNACNLGINEEEKALSEVMVFPNPANSLTTLKFTCKDEHVRVSIYNMQGKLMQVLVEKQIEPGTHQLKMEIGDLPRGQYIIKINKKSGDKQVNLVKI
jgi:uncharacterized protein (DUF1501 family)